MFVYPELYELAGYAARGAIDPTTPVHVLFVLTEKASKDGHRQQQFMFALNEVLVAAAAPYAPGPFQWVDTKGTGWSAWISAGDLPVLASLPQLVHVVELRLHPDRPLSAYVQAQTSPPVVTSGPGDPAAAGRAAPGAAPGAGTSPVGSILDDVRDAVPHQVRALGPALGVVQSVILASLLAGAGIMMLQQTRRSQ